MSSQNYDEIVCTICNKGDNEDVLMLCDDCDRGFHTYCLRYRQVPSGSWYCPSCVVNTSNSQTTQTTTAQTTTTTSQTTAQSKKKKDILKPKQVWVYVRVSSKGQNEEQYGRVGSKTQNTKILQNCMENDYTILGTVSEVGSAYRTKTPKLEKLINIAKQQEPIVVYSVSRFSRNVNNARLYLERLHSKNSYIISVSENITSLDKGFMELVVQSEQESKMISNRSLDAYNRIRKQGGYNGKKPFGYNIVRHNGLRVLKENIIEQDICKKIRQKFNSCSSHTETLNYARTKFPKYLFNRKIIFEIVEKTCENLGYIILKAGSFATDMNNALQEVAV